jgi:hypothetical protein
MNRRIDRMMGERAERGLCITRLSDRLVDLFLPSCTQVWGMLLVLAVFIAAIFYRPV